jgi:hypothetical protein
LNEIVEQRCLAHTGFAAQYERPTLPFANGREPGVEDSTLAVPAQQNGVRPAL